MTRRGGASEAIVVVLVAIALFAVFFSAFLLVPLAVVAVGLLALAVSQRSGARRNAEIAEMQAKPPPPEQSKPAASQNGPGGGTKSNPSDPDRIA